MSPSRFAPLLVLRWVIHAPGGPLLMPVKKRIELGLLIGSKHLIKIREHVRFLHSKLGHGRGLLRRQRARLPFVKG